MPRLIIISGSSGAGKSSALSLLEDEGYYCVDNLPPRLLPEFTNEVLRHPDYDRFHGIAVCIDARTIKGGPGGDPESLRQLLEAPDRLILFLDAQPHILLKRFSETRRRHPLAGPDNSLPEAIARERQYLEFIAAEADVFIDTTDLSPRELRDTLAARIIEHRDGLAVMIESFAFKRGVPTDVDFVFDARALPNPYWQEHLRELTGLDAPVRQFLETDARCLAFYQRLRDFLVETVNDFNSTDRTYLTIAIGCTGGQHRSVFLASKLFEDLKPLHQNLQLRHRHLGGGRA